MGSPVESLNFENYRWKVDATEVEVTKHLGRSCLRLRGGIASVAEARLENGILEFDMAFPRMRGFMGGIWRVKDTDNFEWFYVRPHQSGNPDATQYTPVFHGLAGWQLYHGDCYAVPVKHRFDHWTHVKIVFSGVNADIYLGDTDTPALLVDELKRAPEPGTVGVGVATVGSAHFSNLTFQPMDAPRMQPRIRAAQPVPEGLITSWSVSEAFPENALDAMIALDRAVVQRWTRLQSERTGVTNLARIQGIRDGKNTAFAGIGIHSDRQRLAELNFGFSDRVRVYLNRQLLFRGNDAYQSRDYRFLGSIGFFDTLWLPLKEGQNELLMAVSEDGGGWGVQARFPDPSGLIVHELMSGP